MSSGTSTSTSRRSSWRNSIANLIDLAKEHHHAMNAAHTAYRGGPRQYTTRPAAPSSTASSSRKHSAAAESVYSVSTMDSMDAEKTAAKKEKRGSWSSAWEGVKRTAKDHHVAVNQAYASYYGMGTGYGMNQQTRTGDVRHN